MGGVRKAEAVLYRKGRFYTAEVGTKDLLRNAASPSIVIDRWKVRRRIGSILQ
jgi:hypothetical protein